MNVMKANRESNVLCVCVVVIVVYRVESGMPVVLFFLFFEKRENIPNFLKVLVRIPLQRG